MAGFYGKGVLLGSAASKGMEDFGDKGNLRRVVRMNRDETTESGTLSNGEDFCCVIRVRVRRMLC